MRRILSFALLSTVKILSRVFFRLEVKWLGRNFESPWKPGIRMFVFLNHTSLFEPLLMGGVPFSIFWWGAERLIAPGADKTLRRPIVGTFYKILFPGVTSITRKRDRTWEEFLDSITDDSLITIAPEGRMMRKDGLDSEGNPMSVRGGVADILWRMEGGDMVFIYSGGLHHVQAPGEWFPRLFKTVRFNFERIPINDYKKGLQFSSFMEFKKSVIADMEKRTSECCPRV